jgi:hypothetical protein
MHSLLKLSCVGLVILLVIPLVAAEKEAKKPGKKQAAGPIAGMEKHIADLELSVEQKNQVEGILAKYKPKFAEAAAKAGLTDEQKRAQQEAQAKAKADGKKGKEARAEVQAAVKLTDEQKQKQREAAKSVKELQASLKKDLSEVLKPEQVAKLTPGKKAK